MENTNFIPSLIYFYLQIKVTCSEFLNDQFMSSFFFALNSIFCTQFKDTLSLPHHDDGTPIAVVVGVTLGTLLVIIIVIGTVVIAR